MCEQDRLKVSKQIRDEVLNETGVFVSARTIHRRLVQQQINTAAANAGVVEALALKKGTKRGIIDKPQFNYSDEHRFEIGKHACICGNKSAVDKFRKTVNPKLAGSLCARHEKALSYRKPAVKGCGRSYTRAHEKTKKRQPSLFGSFG